MIQPTGREVVVAAAGRRLAIGLTELKLGSLSIGLPVVRWRRLDDDPDPDAWYVKRLTESETPKAPS